jgi:hypothetical protein
MSEATAQRPSRAIAAYMAFDEALRRVGGFLDARIHGVGSHSAANLAARATQRFAQLFSAQFMNAYTDAVDAGQAPEWLDLGGARLAPARGEIALGARQALALYFDFLARWGYTLLTVLASVRLRPGGGATLVYGLGLADLFRDGDDREFLDYCRRGPIEPLAAARRLIIQAVDPQGRATDPRTSYARSPLHALARSAGLAPGTVLAIAGRHIVNLFALTLRCAASPALLLVARDFADDALAAALDEAGAIEAVVLTTSNHSAQPLWMWARPARRFRVHMAWYSQNVRPLLHKGDPDFPINPVNRLIRADVMWVWNRTFGEYLAGIGVRADMRSVGPILWMLPPGRVPEPSSRPVIAVFDVVPTSVEEDRRLGFVDNYYTAPNMQRFVEDIVATASAAAAGGPRPLVQLKHKREGRQRRDLAYFQFIERLAAAGGDFELLPARTSVYDMLLRCDVAVSPPCSSPAYAATALGKPSIFHDPTGTLAPVLDEAPGLELTSDRGQLEAALARALRRRSSSA